MQKKFMGSTNMLEKINYAHSSMEDGLVDVIVMNLILKKAMEDSTRKSLRRATLDFSTSEAVSNVDDFSLNTETYWCSPNGNNWDYRYEGPAKH
jgi:hypothetical protein